MRILITGGCGFIGSAVSRLLVHGGRVRLLNLDKLTYAATPSSLASIADSPDYSFVCGDVAEPDLVRPLLAKFEPDAVIHLAAESHVDRSIDDPMAFVRTNVLGTGVLLQAATAYRDRLPGDRRDRFRFLHISTDEVYGSVDAPARFNEASGYDPSSPYSASKAGADHLVSAWNRTYGLPTLLTNCSNNYGPYQFPEKLIPLVIISALEGARLPVYGDGLNVRDWVYVDDHARALETVLLGGTPGEKYLVGGAAERTNISVVETICDVVDRLVPKHAERRRKLIHFVEDRPGHDRRYAVDHGKIARELGWAPRETFESGLEKAVRWYIERRDWWEPLRKSVYRGDRLGLVPALSQ